MPCITAVRGAIIIEKITCNECLYLQPLNGVEQHSESVSIDTMRGTLTEINNAVSLGHYIDLLRNIVAQQRIQIDPPPKPQHYSTHSNSESPGYFL